LERSSSGGLSSGHGLRGRLRTRPFLAANRSIRVEASCSSSSEWVFLNTMMPGWAAPWRDRVGAEDVGWETTVNPVGAPALSR
jgi:hypothetical protein